MENIIDGSFFFLHRQTQTLQNIRLSKKASFLIAPLLPFSALIFGLNFAFNTNWLPVLIIPFILTFILGRASYYFLKGYDIFMISDILELLRFPIMELKISRHHVSHIFMGESFEIKLKEESPVANEVTTILFNEVQSKMITRAFNILKKEIISDENLLKDFIVASEGSDLKESQQIKLELESKHCAIFLRNFFIPYVMILTKKELTLAQASKLFKYRKKNSYRPIVVDSISKKHRQLSTKNQMFIYESLLDELKKSVR